MEVVSVSLDSRFVHKMWNDQGLVEVVDSQILFHMASDRAGNVGRAFGVWDENQGIERHGRFSIDPDGVIQPAEVETPPVGRRVSETMHQIQAFQVVRASGGKVTTPAGWLPDEMTFKPGPDLVGNVWKVGKPSLEK